MTAALHRERAGDPSDENAHLRLLLARLWAAEHALAIEIAAGLDVSKEAALVLARMRIEEVVVGGSGSGESEADRVHAHPNVSYCRRCWALLTPDTPLVIGERELFETCSYCGQAAYSEEEGRAA